LNNYVHSYFSVFLLEVVSCMAEFARERVLRATTVMFGMAGVVTGGHGVHLTHSRPSTSHVIVPF